MPQANTAAEPTWFVFRRSPEGMYRAEFLTFDDAVDWARANGGEITDSPTNERPVPKPVPVPPFKPWWLDRGEYPTADNIAAADLCGSSSGEQ